VSPARTRAAVALLPLALTACVSAGPAGEGGPATPGEPLGLFEVAGDAGPTARLSPTRCDSGDPELFLGVDLVDEAQGLVVRLVFDPLDGPILRVFDLAAPHERTVLFFPDECAHFEVSLEPTGWEVNEVRLFRVDLDLDCTTAEGARLTGRAQAGSCG